jgi:hypothetical protein
MEPYQHWTWDGARPNQSGRFGEQKNALLLPGMEPQSSCPCSKLRREKILIWKHILYTTAEYAIQKLNENFTIDPETFVKEVANSEIKLKL